MYNRQTGEQWYEVHVPTEGQAAMMPFIESHEFETLDNARAFRQQMLAEGRRPYKIYHLEWNGRMIVRANGEKPTV